MKKVHILKNFKLVTALVLSFGLAFSGQSYVVFAGDSDINSADSTQKELDELNNKYAELEKQQTELKNKISQAKNEKERKEAEKLKTENDIEIIEKQIDILVNTIELIKKEVNDKTEEIKKLENSLQDSSKMFKERFKSMYINDSTSTLGVVLGANSYSEYLSFSEFATRMAMYDKKLMDDIMAKKQAQTEAQTKLDESLAALESAENSIYKKSDELDTLLSKTTNQIQNLSELEKQYTANADEVSKKMAEMKAEIDEVYRILEEQKKQEDAEMEYVGGGFAYPVAYFPNRKITSYYGWRFNGTDYHTGIDIAGAGANGQPVRAANSGKVIYIKNTYVYGVGYGRYIIVDHGGGYTTLYAHLQSIATYVGQTVEKGDIIGYVGNTGWSTGPHLHFEIRINNKHTNPLNHLPPL